MKASFKVFSIRIILAAVAALLVVPAVLAQDDATYDELLATYGGWTREDVEAAGYEVEPFCINAVAIGAPAELGGMGVHAVNPELLTDGVTQTSKPDVILLDTDGNVIGVEYEIDSVVESPPTIDGHPLVFTPPHPGTDHDHMSLHVFFVGDEANRFGTWNPAVSCPEGTTPPPPTLPVSGAGQDAGGFSLLLIGLVVGLIGAGFYIYGARVNRLA